MVPVYFLRSSKFLVFASWKSLTCSPEFSLAIDHLPKSGFSIFLVLPIFSDSAHGQAWSLHLGTCHLFPCLNFSLVHSTCYCSTCMWRSHFLPPRHLLLSLALPLLQTFHNSPPWVEGFFWECQLVIKIRTWCHRKVNGNATYQTYFHGAINGHSHFSLHLSLCRLTFISLPFLRARAPDCTFHFQY